MKALTLFTIAVLGFSASFAAGMPKATEKSWRDKITLACEKNAIIQKNKKEICSCVGKNYILVSRDWNGDGEKAEILQYTLDFYSGDLTQEEVDADPFFLDDIDFDISEGCIANPKFTVGD